MNPALALEGALSVSAWLCAQLTADTQQLCDERVAEGMNFRVPSTPTILFYFVSRTDFMHFTFSIKVTFI